MSHEYISRHSPIAWTLSLLLPACYSGTSADANSDTAGPPGGGDNQGSQEWPVEEAFPGVPGTPATLTVMTRKGPVEVEYRHLDNGYGVLEGDIVLYGPEGSTMRSRPALDGLTSRPRPQHGGVTTVLGKRWIDRRILWEYHPTLAPPEGDLVRKGFEQAMKDIMKVVDVTFVAYDENVDGVNADRIQVQQTGDGCWSSLGRQGNAQQLELSSGCAPGGASGIAIHELSHAIGLLHEQSRADRDLHVSVKAGNVCLGKGPQFAVGLTDDIGAYNTASIMHYGSCDFSKCTNPNTPKITQCWSVNEQGMQSSVCGYADRENAECTHCECLDEDGWCKYPTILGPGETPIYSQRTELKQSDIAALEYALGCPDGVDGEYCGDVIGLDTGTLYTCADGYYDIKEVCDEAGCKPSLAPGNNDSCTSGTPDPDVACATGPCCENGEFSPPGTVCAEDADVEYGCPWGTDAGADVGVRTRDRTCSGVSGACNGVYGEWSAWSDQPYDACSDAEYCDPGDPSCNDSPPIPDCDGGACCDPDGFLRAPGYVCLNDENSEYGCPWGTGLGDDVGVRYRDLTCSGSSSACDGSYAPWETWQTEDDCSDMEVCTPGQMVCSCDEQFEVLDYEYPSWGPPGCSGDGSVKLKASAELVSPTSLRMHVRKADDTAFGAGATLSLYVGSPIKCPDPPNVVKETQGIAVGQVEQTIELSLNPYDGAWAMEEVKNFWVGKDEGGFESFRATDMVSIRRVCIP